MYSPDRSFSDSPLSIASMFRRQAAALGITVSARQPLAPLARFEQAPPPVERDGRTVARFVQETQSPEHPVSADNDCL
jgi:hypothetical protein